MVFILIVQPIFHRVHSFYHLIPNIIDAQMEIINKVRNVKQPYSNRAYVHLIMTVAWQQDIAILIDLSIQCILRPYSPE